MKVKKICIMILATTMFLSSVGCADDEETSSTSLIIGSTTPVEDLPPADFLSHLDESYFSEINFDNTDTSMLNSELVFHDISFSINNDWKKEEVSEDEIKDLQDKLQKMTDQFIKDVDAAIDAKSKEIMTV